MLKALKYASIYVISTVAIVSVTGCNTVHGMGQDVQAGGTAVSHTASEVQSEMHEATPPPISNTGYTGESLASGAQIDIVHARARALAARAGVVVDQELERETGGNGLRYSFDIRSDGVVYEVGVDANTGAILENAREGAHPD